MELKPQITTRVSKMRLDVLLSLRGLVTSRERARGLILAGRVLVNEQKIDKPGTECSRRRGAAAAGRRFALREPWWAEAGCGAGALED